MSEKEGDLARGQSNCGCVSRWHHQDLRREGGKPGQCLLQMGNVEILERGEESRAGQA